MPRLLLLASLVLAAALAALLFAFTSEPFQAGTENAVEEPAEPLTEVAALGEVESRRRTEERSVEVVEPPKTSNRPREKKHAGKTEAERAREVHVVVRLKHANDPSYSFANHRVEAQSWIGDTGEVFTHTTQADASGKARIIFQEEVHVDWVKYLPPDGSGLCFAVEEDHIDLDLGDEYEVELETSGAATIRGRLVDLDGHPVAGAIVHGYWGGIGWNEIEDFDPGPGRAVSGADGTFAMDDLPPSRWGIAVEPRAWLQIDPHLETSEVGVSVHELEAGEVADAGTFTLAPMHETRFEIVDPSGAPLEDMRVRMSPVAFRDPSLALGSREELEMPNDLSTWLPEFDDRSPGTRWTWQEGSLDAETNAQGVVHFYALPGAWELTIVPPMTRSSRDPAVHRERVEVPCAPRRIVMQSLAGSVSGTIVGADGPLARATAQLVRRMDGRSRNQRTRTAADGSFAFERLPSDGEYELRVWKSGHVGAAMPVDVLSKRPYSLRLREAGVLRVRLVDLEGNPLPNLVLDLLEQVSHIGPPHTEAEIHYVGNRSGRSQGRSQADDEGRVVFTNLQHGTHEVALRTPRPRNRSRSSSLGSDYAYRWVLATGDEEHELRVQLQPLLEDAQPILALHEGVVVDGVTGQGVSRARIWIHGDQGGGGTRTNGSGEFELRVAAGEDASARVDKTGYLPFAEAVGNGAGSHRHEFRLQPARRELVLHVQDALGRALPAVEIRFQDLGRTLRVHGPDEDGDVGWTSTVLARDGTVSVGSLPPGNLRLLLSAGGYDLATIDLEVPSGTARDERTVRLDRTLEDLRAELEQRWRAEPR